MALDDFSLPGTPGFPLNNVYSVPVQDHSQMDLLRSYLQQFRQELAMRLIQRIYVDATTGTATAGPSKFWLAFTRRRFMNKSL